MAASEYSVLIGDISKSRNLGNRSRLQQILARALVDANQVFRDPIVTRLSITLGDEYQGVFKDPGSALRAAMVIANHLHPVKLHHGIGIGPISTPIDKEFAGRMDGPAFHCARAAINRGRKQKAWLTLEGIGQPEDELISASMALWGRTWESRTERQRQVIKTVQQTTDQVAAAKRLRVRPASVTDVLQAAKYNELNRLKAAALAFLGNRAQPARRDSP